MKKIRIAKKKNKEMEKIISLSKNLPLDQYKKLALIYISDKLKK
jgi:hypothetical protein